MWNGHRIDGYIRKVEIVTDLLVVSGKALACYAGDSRFDLHVENWKFSRDLHQQNPSSMSFI